ncbi:MAG: phytoene/squalene synthase family protein [Acidobacteria bacterium]|nr:phytoene/squalene synthase family protein [Acidobacteriota bacterium]
MPESTQVAASYEHCRQLAKRAARNFYYGFRLLPSEKRNALCALYAFMRRADDISDDAGSAKAAGLSAWRAALDRALGGDYDGHRSLPALHHAVTKYDIPARCIHDVISGAEMDLTVFSYASFDRLQEYCYRVAGAVGLCCIHVFGFPSGAGRAPELAEKLGIAFQLTNILRDIPRDLAMGRTYLPQDELERFGCPPGKLAEWAQSAASEKEFHDFMKFQVARAWEFYNEGLGLIPLVNEDSRAALWALADIYSGILQKIEARDYAVFSQPPARLTTAEKVWTLARARFGLWRGRTRNSIHSSSQVS